MNECVHVSRVWWSYRMPCDTDAEAIHRAMFLIGLMCATLMERWNVIFSGRAHIRNATCGRRSRRGVFWPSDQHSDWCAEILFFQTRSVTRSVMRCSTLTWSRIQTPKWLAVSPSDSNGERCLVSVQQREAEDKWERATFSQTHLKTAKKRMNVLLTPKLAMLCVCHW